MKNKRAVAKLEKLDFHGKTLLTAQVNGKIRVIMRPIVEAIGLNWASQSVKLRKNKKFNCCDIATVGADGKVRKMLDMPIEKFPTWLSELNPLKVKKNIRDTMILFQEESCDAMYKYWYEGKVENPRFQKIKQINTYAEALPELRALRQIHLMRGFNRRDSMIKAMDDLKSICGFDYPAALGLTRKMEIKRIDERLNRPRISKTKESHYKSNFCGWLRVLLGDEELWKEQSQNRVCDIYAHYCAFCDTLHESVATLNIWYRLIHKVFDKHVLSYQKAGESRRYYRFADLDTCRLQYEKYSGDNIWYRRQTLLS